MLYRRNFETPERLIAYAFADLRRAGAAASLFTTDHEGGASHHPRQPRDLPDKSAADRGAERLSRAKALIEGRELPAGSAWT